MEEAVKDEPTTQEKIHPDSKALKQGHLKLLAIV